MTITESKPEQATGKVSLPTLTAMVVGSTIASGMLLLQRRFGTEPGA
jgi:arginine:ornithine antiporter / lysine permease